MDKGVTNPDTGRLQFGRVYMVQPDGFVGFRGPPADHPARLSWIGDWMLSAA
jgi:hypothetical protein